MKNHPFLLALLLVALSLSACRRGAAPTSTPTSTEAPLSDVYTSVAVTLTAQALQATPTLALPTLALPTLAPLPTLAASATVFPTLPSTQVPPTTLPTNANVCDNSGYVSDVTIPDGTIMAPGQAFVKTWMLKNTGTCTWSKKYSLNFASGEQMGGADTKIGESVAPGEQVKISVSMIAPQTTKTYTGYWRMANESGKTFGATVWVQIVVSGNATTLTPTITRTPTPGTGTVTATSTTAPAATKTPTSPPTSTTAPTNTTAPTHTSEPTSTETPPPSETPTP